MQLNVIDLRKFKYELSVKLNKLSVGKIKGLHHQVAKMDKLEFCAKNSVSEIPHLQSEENL